MDPQANSRDPNLKRQRLEFEKRISTANDEDDPLAVYVQYVQWIVNNYGENDPKSGLLKVLEKVTEQFAYDSVYKTDLRFLKLWILYANQVERPIAIAIYAFLLKNEIGTSYSVLYEEYAKMLEADGKASDAQAVYRMGITRQARPQERLKTRYADFQKRHGTSSPASSPASTSPIIPASISSKSTKSQMEVSTRPSKRSKPRTSAGSTSSSSSSLTTAASRYALMLAPPAPGKRPEKLQFDLSLLYTEEAGEFSIQEARARSMGLLGKKWPPLPPESHSSMSSASSSRSSSSSVAVSFNDDGRKNSTRTMGMRRKSVMGGEPTVTINTKEALADVFGMYNSPEKTMKLTGPGSKHAPLKSIEPITPLVVAPVAAVPRLHENENAKTPTPAFRPYVDDKPNPSRKENKPTPSKFTPYVDPESSKKPLATPRAALSLKDPASATPSALSRSENENPSKQGGIKVLKLKPLFESDESSENAPSSKVFSAETVVPPLAPLRDVFTDDHGKPLPKPKPVTHERAKSYHDVQSPSTSSANGNENARTPFKVFSRPDLSENVFTPKPAPAAAFKVHVDVKPTFQPYRDDPEPEPQEDFAEEQDEAAYEEPPAQNPSWGHGTEEVEQGEDEQEEEEESYDDDFDAPEEYQIPLPPIDGEYAEYDEGDESFRDPPLGGRFGQFNVMTPITERTFEYTSSTRSGFENTPSARLRKVNEAEEEPPAPQPPLGYQQQDGDYEEEDDGYEEHAVEPLRLSVDTVTGAGEDSEEAPSVLEEQTGKLSLADALTLSSNFRPQNPCNPFDPPIMSSLLSRLPSDPQYYDLRSQEANMLDGLQKFAKRARKTSGNASNTGTFDISSSYPLVLAGHKFQVSSKLGEGGFGAVFQAKDLGMKQQDEDTDDEDDDLEDEEDSSAVAIKVVKPRNLWEYHVLRRLHSALPAPLHRSVVLPHALYAWRDESFLILDLCSQGSLLDIVNKAGTAGVSQQGACLDELLVMFFAVELMRLLEAMHNIGFIHGDLKIDNCLLRLEDVPGGSSAWESTYQPSGAGGWSSKGLKLIDFGRTIDTRLFPSGQQFIAEWQTDERDCVEIREGRPWTFQSDYYGLAGIVYCMLFGKYMQANAVTTVAGEERRKIATPFKRYWQTELWGSLFDVLLNPCEVRQGGQLPVSEELGALRKQMEVWLQGNCNRTSNTLKGLLKKVEMSCLR